MSDDLIKRSDAIKAVRKSKWWHFCDLIPVLSAIKDIPSADSPRGEWIKYAPEDIGCYNCECSLCRERFFIPLRKGEVPYSFCPNCGADMREREDE